MTLGEMRRVLTENGLQLTKSLGQNFLHDGNQLRRIVAAAALHKEDKVLEIGPGLGPLTELLLAQAGLVLAIEKDRRLAEFLRRRFRDAANLTLRQRDAREQLREQRDWGDWKVVSNLPYSVASPLLVELAQAAGAPRLIVVTLQLEVACRILARAGEPDCGVLTLLLQLPYEVTGHFKIPASCFFPTPEVDSACLTLRRRPAPLLAPEQTVAFTALVKRAFSQRRKMMLKLLKEDWPTTVLETAFAVLRISPQARAETVSLEQFVRLTQWLAPTSTDERRDL